MRSIARGWWPILGGGERDRGDSSWRTRLSFEVRARSVSWADLDGRDDFHHREKLEGNRHRRQRPAGIDSAERGIAALCLS
jgi:hypothetical protein